MAEFGDECLQILSPLLGSVDVSEEVAQRVGEELVAEVMESHQLIQDIAPADKRRLEILHGAVATGG